MPLEMPGDALITIKKRELASDFRMPQMEKAESHYSLGYIISGDRRFITPYEQYDAHAGDVTAMPPGIYHRTFSLSNQPYINYLIKISPMIGESFCRDVDKEIWDYVFEKKRFNFDNETRNKIQLLLEDMVEIYDKGEAYAGELLKGLFYRLLVLIRENDIAGDNSQFKGKLSHDIMEAMYFIEQNYAEPIKLSDVAGKIGFSEGHFSRLFSSQVGVPFSTYLINVRIRHAKEMLINTDHSISEIALMTGFGSGDYLSACFNKYDEITPKDFRKRLKQQKL